MFDTMAGVLMNFAYGWGFLNPARKVYYNVAITVMSVFIALAVGSVQLGSVLADNVGWESPFLEWFDSLEFLGFVIAGTLIATWLISLVVWRVGRFEEKLKIPA